MEKFASFREVIELWSTREDLAADVGAGAWAVSKWWQRNFIPADWWASVLSTEKAKNSGITAEVLTALAARENADEARA